MRFRCEENSALKTLALCGCFNWNVFLGYFRFLRVILRLRKRSVWKKKRKRRKRLEKKKNPRGNANEVSIQWFIARKKMANFILHCCCAFLCCKRSEWSVRISVSFSVDNGIENIPKWFTVLDCVILHAGWCETARNRNENRAESEFFFPFLEVEQYPN